MARAPSEEPQGPVYEPELLSVEEEARLLERLESLRFDPIVLHGRAALTFRTLRDGKAP